MLTNTLQNLFSRDLNKLKHELELYQHEENIWLTHHQISNCAGNLALHLIGNLNAYIGGVLGHSGYVRNRPEEFSRKNVPRQQLIREIEDVAVIINNVLPALTMTQLEDDYPEEVSVGKVSTSYFLIHLATHLNYHLGQINYHRRLLDLSVKS